MAYDGKELSKAEIERIVEDYDAYNEYGFDGIRRRRPAEERATSARDIALAAGLGTLSASEARKFAHTQAGKAIQEEYDRIRRDPERQARQLDEMQRTYAKYVDRTGNPVEKFIPMMNEYAAATLDDGTDVVIFDPTAPHAGIMAHELGHITQNHSNDPISYLQHSGLGRWSGENDIALGGGGAAIGSVIGQAISRLRGGKHHLKNQAMGAAAGGVLGTAAASGQTIYELGASARAFDYLPDDIDRADVAGDLIRAGSTYAMGGPGQAAVTAMGVGGAALLAAHPRSRHFLQRKAGDIFGSMMNAPHNSNTTTATNPIPRASAPSDGFHY